MVRVVGLLGRVVPRPSDASLESLARVDRPSPPVEVPTAEALGIIDHLTEGRRAVAAGLYGEALVHFGELIEADDANSWAWHGRGDALQLLGDAEGALDAYSRAEELAPSQGLHALGRANALEALGRPEAAAEATARGLSLDPSLSWMRS